MRNRVFTEFQSTFHQISNFTLPGRYHLNQVIKGSVTSDRASCDSDASWQNAMKDAWSKSNHEGLTRQTLNEGLLQNIWPLRETKVRERLQFRPEFKNLTRANCATVGGWSAGNMQVEMSSVISPWLLTQWKEGGGWFMFCCTLSDADPPPG